jgi:hypothetical protein
MKTPDRQIAGLMDQAYSIVDLCSEVLVLRERVAELQEYEQKYRDLLSSSIKHSDTMMSEQLRLLCTPGVMTALVKENTK